MILPVSVRVYHPDPVLKEKLGTFYQKVALQWDTDWDCLIILREQDKILAAGCRKGQVLKGIGVDPVYQSAGLAAAVVSELIKEASEQGFYHLFLFTRPGNRERFRSMGFFPVIETPDVLMLENRRHGLEHYLNSIPKVPFQDTGCIVAHANPFTVGHLALLQKAAESCRWIYLFILSEKTEPFSPEDRFKMAELAAAQFPNVTVVPSGEYLISHTTFPDYFYPDKVMGRTANCRLDLMLFAKRIAPSLSIQARFVGQEPYSAVTADYNRMMAEILPGEGIDVYILPRVQKDGQIISATRVRKALAEGDWKTVASLTPEVCHPVLRKYLTQKMI